MKSAPERLCSFGGGPGRSWTDVYTNHTFVGPIIPTLGVEEILDGRLPDVVLPYFLHEATHHACLNSPLGMAIGATAFRARELASSGTEADLAEARRDDARIATVLRVYRPLLEGLAMFAELDAMPGASAVASTPMNLALDLFVRESAEGKPPDEAFFELWSLLSDIRTKADVFGRKTRLLSEPLLSAEGYLLGYLAIKSFSTWATLITNKFEDFDFALGYAMHHFCWDYDLVNLLLERSPFDGGYAAAVNEHLAERLDSLFSKESLQSAADKFEAELLSDTPHTEALDDVVLPPEALGNDPEDAERARRLLVDTLAVLSEDWKAQIARRGLLHLQSIPVDLEFQDDSFVALYEGRPLLAGQASSVTRNSSRAHGSVDVFYETSTMVQGFAVSIDGRIIMRSVNSRTDEMLPWLDQFMVAREHVVDAADASAEQLNAAVGDPEWIKTRDTLLTSIQSRRDEIYQHYALLWLDPERRPGFVRAARDEGFAAVVGHGLIGSLTLLGLIDGLGAYLEDVNFVAGSAGLEADCEEIVATMEAAFGGTPFLFDAIEDDGKQRTRVRAFL